MMLNTSLVNGLHRPPGHGGAGCLLLIVSLVVIGGLVLLLGSWCSWWSVVVNDRCDDAPHGRKGIALRVSMAAVPQN